MDLPAELLEHGMFAKPLPLASVTLAPSFEKCQDEEGLVSLV